MKFMVVIKMRGEFDDSFMSLVEEDVKYANKLKEEGILESLYMRDDLRVCWAIYNAESKQELQQILQGFPLYPRLDYAIDQLHPDD